MKDIKEFYDKVSKDLSKRYCKFEFELNGDNYEIHDDVIHISINSHALYSMYANKEIPYDGGVLGTISYMIDLKTEEYYNTFDYCKIYPILRHKDWSDNDPKVRFLRKRLFLDIDVLYVLDLGDGYRYIKETDNLDFDKIYKDSWGNIENIDNGIEKLNELMEIFSLKQRNHCSILFNSKIEKEIRQKIGLNYIFIIPTDSSLVIAPNTNDYIHIIEKLIDKDEDPTLVSSRVYGHINGEYQYMD